MMLPCRVVGVSVVMWLIVLVCVLISGPIGDGCGGAFQRWCCLSMKLVWTAQTQHPDKCKAGGCTV